MKKKVIFSVIVSAAVIFTGCRFGNDGINNDDDSSVSKRTKNLNFLFGTDSAADITVNISRTEWNKMLVYYDWWSSNETSVKAEFVMSKTDSEGEVHTYTASDSGIRIRGNTSRKRPQSGDGKGNNDYQQAHFKIDFEEFLPEGEEKKIANCMKGVILKRFKDDPTYAREVYAYNFFRNNGIWTAPRCGYAHVVINIFDGEVTENPEEGTYESVDYGIYEMVEQIDKQFLKERTSSNGGGTFENNTGNLWKCSWGASLSNYSNKTSNMGVEKKEFNDFTWSDDIFSTSNPGHSSESEYGFYYDLKTNKSDLSTAQSQLSSFITSLNSIESAAETEKKNWFNSHMDVDLFLKTYAASVSLGMWDDYWANCGNNYYMYFDTDGKFYFIPYDYDNVLGVNCFGIDFANRDPLEWKPEMYSDKKVPLIEIILTVSEFKQKYITYLKELTASGSYFDASVSKKQIETWHKMIKDNIYSSQLIYSDTYSSFDDHPATWGTPYIVYKIYTLGSDNYFTVRRNTILNYAK